MKKLFLITIFVLCIYLGGCNNMSSIEESKEQTIETNSSQQLSNLSTEDNTKMSNDEKTYVEGKYPIHWNLSDYYNNVDEWEADFKKFSDFYPTLVKYKGKINSVDGIYNYIQEVYESEYYDMFGKLFCYVLNSKDLNYTDGTFLNLHARLNKLETDFNLAISFFEEEMNKLSIEELNKLFSDEKLKPYRYYFKSYFDENRPRYGEEALKVMIQAKSNYGASENAFNALQYTDMKDYKITMPDGSEKEVNDEMFDEYTYGNHNDDRKLKKQVEDLYYKKSENYINTLTSLLYNNMKEVYNEVKLNNEKHVLDSCLKNASVDKRIYTNIVDTTHRLLPSLQKFLKIKKEKLGYDSMHYMDVLAPYSKYNASVTYDDAVDMVKSALNLLGDEYINNLDDMVSSGHLDVYPANNKYTGGYSRDANIKGIKPFILLNYTGFISQVKTIAHELGHSLYSIFSTNNIKNKTNSEMGIFLQEVASTFNENIFSMYRIDNAKSDEEKLYFIEDRINDINATLIRQILYSEFEEWLYKKVENGENFVADELCDKWMELHKIYYGDDVEFVDGMKYRWSSIPHFYSPFYVYKYATSITFSSILSREVYENKEGAKENYINFLKSGESEEPDKVLKKAGIDVIDTKTYDVMVEYYDELVRQFEELVNK